MFASLGLLAVAVVLFAWERVSYDATAVIILATLMLTGILTPAQALSGFSNVATVTIGAMFVLSEGLRRTGMLEYVGDYFSRLGEASPWRALGIMMVVIGTISAFINNTAAIAIFIPVVLGVAGQLGVSPSRLLMPVSFASMFGGVCTLIGTSTNILVSSIAADHGAEPFSMFEFAPLGLVFFVVGFAYLFFVGIRMIPERRGQEDLTTSFGMTEYLTDIVLKNTSEHVGKTLDETTLTRDLDVDIVQVLDGEREMTAHDAHAPLQAGDVLRVRGSIQEINRLLAREDLTLKTAREWYDQDLETGGGTLVEAVVAPDSSLEKQPLAQAVLLDRLGAIVLAVRHHGRVRQEDLGRMRLSGGDSLLLSMEHDRLPEVGTLDGHLSLGEGSTARSFEATVSPVENVRGTPIGRVITFHDVSEYLRQEQRLKVLNRILRHNVRNELTTALGHLSTLEATAEAVAAGEEDAAFDPSECRRTVDRATAALERLLSNTEKALSLRDVGLEPAARRDQDLVPVVRQAVATTRQLTVDLSPPVLKGEGLAQALLRDEIVDLVQEATGPGRLDLHVDELPQDDEHPDGQGRAQRPHHEATLLPDLSQADLLPGSQLGSRGLTLLKCPECCYRETAQPNLHASSVDFGANPGRVRRWHTPGLSRGPVKLPDPPNDCQGKDSTRDPAACTRSRVRGSSGRRRTLSVVPDSTILP